MGILSRLFGPRPKDRPGVYSIVNRRTGCVYIGASGRSITERWAKHRRDLAAGRHHNKRLQADWDRYGSRGFRFVVLEVVEEPAAVFDREQAWQRARWSADGCYNPHPDVARPFIPRRRGPINPTEDDWRRLFTAFRKSGRTADQARSILRPFGVAVDDDRYTQS